MITELNFAKLTPAAWAIAAANNVDVGVGRSMLLHNLREGKEMNPMAELPDEFTPDWAALSEQYNATDPKERAGVSSAVNVWHRVCQDNYKTLVELWNQEPRSCAGMVEVVEHAIDPGPIGGPARQEWEENQKKDEADLEEDGELQEPAPEGDAPAGEGDGEAPGDE